MIAAFLLIGASVVFLVDLTSVLPTWMRAGGLLALAITLLALVVRLVNPRAQLPALALGMSLAVITLCLVRRQR